MLEISCAKARAALTSPPELLTAGMAKVVTVHFAFSPDWDGLRKTAVFSDGWRTVDVLEAAWTDGCVPIPHEVLQTAGRNVRVGVYGSDSTGVALPTVWAELGRVRPAADPSGDTSTDPTAPVWSQLQGQIGDLDKLTTTAKSTLVAAINEAAHSGGGGDGSAVLYTKQNLTASQQKQARTNIDVAGYNVIKYLWPTEHSGREDTDITTLLDSDVYMGIVRNSTAFPSPGLVMLQGPMTGNMYTAVLLAKDGLTYTSTFQYVRSTKHFAVLTPVAAASSKLISVKLTPSESDVNVYTADRNIIEIKEALQAGHMALAYTPDAAGLQNSVGLITSCVRNSVTVLDCWDTGLASTRWQVGADGRTWTETDYVEYAPSDLVANLEMAMPKPVGKTDAMTQAVGMDETGKLWTQPGASGGSAETWELIASGEMSEAATLSLTKDADGTALALKSCCILIDGALTCARGQYICFRAARYVSGKDYDRYDAEINIEKDNPSVRAAYVCEYGKPPFAYIDSGKGSIPWQITDAAVFLGIHRNYASGYDFTPTQHTLNMVYVGQGQGSGKLGAGCKYALWGVRA